MGFLNLALKNLQRHRIRSLLTMLGIAASVGVLFSVFSFNRGFEQGLAKELAGTGLHFMVVPSGCAHEVASLVLHGAVIPKYLDTKVMESIGETEGIALATPILVAQLPNPEQGRVDLIYGVEMKALAEIKPGWRIEGAIPDGPDEVLLGHEVAEHAGLRPGDELGYPGAATRFKVAGVIGLTGSQDDAFIYMPIRTAQALLGNPTGATAIGVKVTDPERLLAITDELAERVPGIQIVTMGQVMNSISNLAASAKSLSISIALIAVLVSAIGVMNSILMAVFERSQEIGMMRAIGASRWDIFRIILKETTMLTMTGGLAGILFATVGSRLIEIFVRTIMPYVPKGEMVRFEPGLALASVSFVFVIGLIAGLYPAWKASTINPIEAIKG
jgi:putative ABC transport system permease protein